MRINMEEALKLELAANEEKERKREEEVAQMLAEMRRMQPLQTAKENYQRYGGSLPVYYVDWTYDMHSFDPSPAPVCQKSNYSERPFTWKTRIETRWVTHEEDPNGLAPGESELREVVVAYKSYVVV